MPARRAAGKSAAAFRTISEVSDELDVPQHVLRFWEGKFSQVRPLKRGGGRRYYRPEDIDLLRRIRNLLYSEGYTIKGVQRLLREGRGKDDEAEVDGTPQAVDGDGGADSELKAVIAELGELRDLLKKAGKGS
jgi:DNA-binding transcriptional MerR regulator